MYRCKKCNSMNVVCSTMEIETQAGNDLYVNTNFGKINACIQLCWCSDCGTNYDIVTLNIEKLDNL